MNNKEFKKLFDEVAKSNGFESIFDGWFKDSAESIVVLCLQKSNYGNYYEMNIKIFIQGMFGNNYFKSKDLVKKDIGDVFRRQPSEYKRIFDFEEPINDKTRKVDLSIMFSNFIVPFTDKALTKVGIKELEENGEIYLLPAIKKEL